MQKGGINNGKASEDYPDSQGDFNGFGRGIGIG
jgi:hypothetical protein